MPVTKVGIVYYADDPTRRVFRVVFPEHDDAELDQPPTDENRDPYLRADGSAHSWITLGTNPKRTAVLEKVPRGSPRARLRSIIGE